MRRAGWKAAFSLSVLFATAPVMAAEIAFWTPDAPTVERVDAEIAKLSEFQGGACAAPDLSKMARHYWGLIDKNGHHLIIGELHVLKAWPTETAGIHIESQPFMVTDGGCGRAGATYDADTSKLMAVGWGGFA